MENVILVRFDDRRGAEEALSRLRTLADEGDVTLHVGVLAERQRDGRVVVLDEAERPEFEATIAGGLVGALLGALAGPAGLLIGGTAGFAVGSLADTEPARDRELIVGGLSGTLPLGATAIVADVDESAPDVLDRTFDDLGGAVSRWPASRLH